MFGILFFKRIKGKVPCSKRTYKSKVQEPWSKGYEFSNTMLHPDLNDYSAIEFWNGSKMYQIGYEHALSFIPKIKEDIERLKNNKKK